MADFKDLIQDADWKKEKHIPAIEASDGVKKGEVAKISVIVGKEIAEMVIAFHAGDVKKATELHLKLLALFKVLFITANPTPVKAALAMVGRPVGGTRLPLIDASEKEKEMIHLALKGLDLVK